MHGRNAWIGAPSISASILLLFDPAGQPDPSYGTDGGLAPKELQSGGWVWGVEGNAAVLQGQSTIRRATASGELDPSFGADGSVRQSITDDAGRSFSLTNAHVRRDGSFLLSGSRSGSSSVEAFQGILERSKVKLSHDIVHERITLTDRINELVDVLRARGRVAFHELFEGMTTRFDLVITFLALLEMTRLRMTRLFQTDFESPIFVEFTAQTVSDEEILAEHAAEAEPTPDPTDEPELTDAPDETAPPSEPGSGEGDP